MTKLNKRIITAITTGSLLLQSALPVFAATTTLTITGNGSDSESKVELGQQSTTTVVQQNATSVNNQINVKSETGSNSASDNTAGDVLVDTGDSNVKVAVTNQLNSNSADIESCDCANDTTVEVSGNGTGTENEVELLKQSATNLFQTNVANVNNDVEVDSKTGDNSADDNTGGDVVIRTGDAKVEVKADTMANANSARISAGNGSGSETTLKITGNGEDSENEIELTLAKLDTLSQDNLTSIRNHFDVDADTGRNTADDSTGGLVGILTGDSIVKAAVTNEAGFNAADLGCDCVIDDVEAKVGQNGTDTENEIEATLTSDRAMYQDNTCGMGKPQYEGLSSFGFDFPRHFPTPCFDNNMSLDGVTGDNNAYDNTGAVDSNDPLVVTGDSTVEAAAHNAGGSNVIGSSTGSEWNWPTNSGNGMELNLSFDLSDLLAFLATR